MHNAFRSWRRAARAVLTGHHHGGCGPDDCGWGGNPEEMEEHFGAGFGVRRPLRFLAFKLGLDERQVAEIARILDALKTERAQAEVDRRRSVAQFADALAADAFDEGKARESGELRVKSAERLRDAVLTALRQIHAVLTAEQRVRLAYLIRAGVLTV
jgi:Spy/CpxP family protein refolding chaperone